MFMERAARVETPTAFFPSGHASPFNVDMPILKPVKEPGPDTAANRSIWEMSSEAFSRWDLIEGRSHIAWRPALPTLHSDRSVLSSRRAMEPVEEEVSMASIFSAHLRVQLNLRDLEK
jgi:hypothetical protein